MSDFPVALTNAVDGSPPTGTEILAKHINNLEAKIGIDGSVVATSIDCLIKGAGGWIPVVDTWTYGSADGPTFTFTVPGDRTSILYPGVRIKLTQTSVKYFIVTASSYGAPNTTVTIYGGTDYALVSAAITNPYFSTSKVPLGFPLNPTKWTVELNNNSFLTQSSPVSGTWYNTGSLTLSVPVGCWWLEYSCNVYPYKITGIASLDIFATLSSSSSSESDPDMTTYVFNALLAANPYLVGFVAPLYAHKAVTLVTKTAYYLLLKTVTASLGALYLTGNSQKTIIRAVCAYL